MNYVYMSSSCRRKQVLQLLIARSSREKLFSSQSKVRIICIPVFNWLLNDMCWIGSSKNGLDLIEAHNLGKR